jgi:hypothetical protein
MKWCIRITEENRNTLIEWVESHKNYDNNYHSFMIDEFVVSEISDNSYQHYTTNINNLIAQGYIEIDFDYFKESIMIKKELPEYWCIKNTDQVIRDWFAHKYDDSRIRDWKYEYIGYDNCLSHNGVLGCYSPATFDNKNIEITFEEFKTLVLKEIKINEDLSYLIKLFKKLKIK